MPTVRTKTTRWGATMILGLLTSLVMTVSWASDSGPDVLVDTGEKLFDPAQHQLVSYSDAEVNLGIVRRGKYLSVSVEPRGLPGSVLELPNEFAQVDQIRRVIGDKAVVLGWANSSVKAVAILDLQRQSIIDHFWAYEPTLSPDGRWIAFIKFFPAHGVDSPESQYRLYDVAKTTTGNRPRRPDRGTGAPDPVTEVGVSIYPLRASEIDRENVGVDDGTAHESASPFFWDADSSKLVFADAQAATMSIVMVSMSPTASVQHKTWIVELRGKVDVCADDCTGVRLKSVHFSEATLETEFEQIIAGRKLPKTASRIQLPLTELGPAPR